MKIVIEFFLFFGIKEYFNLFLNLNYENKFNLRYDIYDL